MRPLVMKTKTKLQTTAAPCIVLVLAACTQPAEQTAPYVETLPKSSHTQPTEEQHKVHAADATVEKPSSVSPKELTAPALKHEPSLENNTSKVTLGSLEIVRGGTPDIDLEEISKVLQSMRMSLYRNCFHEISVDDPSFRQDVVVEFQNEPIGVVALTEAIMRPQTNSQLASCAAELLRNFRFPSSTTAMTFRVAFHFDASAEEVESNKPDKSRTEESAIQPRLVRGGGTIDMEKVTRVLQRAGGMLDLCFERAIKRSPRISRALSVQIEINADGRVTEVRNANGLSSSIDLQRCVFPALKNHRFPDAKSGNAKVAYTHIYQQGDAEDFARAPPAWK